MWWKTQNHALTVSACPFDERHGLHVPPRVVCSPGRKWRVQARVIINIMRAVILPERGGAQCFAHRRMRSETLDWGECCLMASRTVDCFPSLYVASFRRVSFPVTILSK